MAYFGGFVWLLFETFLDWFPPFLLMFFAGRSIPLGVALGFVGATLTWVALLLTGEVVTSDDMVAGVFMSVVGSVVGGLFGRTARWDQQAKQPRGGVMKV